MYRMLKPKWGIIFADDWDVPRQPVAEFFLDGKYHSKMVWNCSGSLVDWLA